MIINSQVYNSNTYFSYPGTIPFNFKIWREGNIEGTNYYTNFNWSYIDNSITGTSYYVNPLTGSDSNQGTQESPLKSIKAALQKTDRGTIYLYPTLYKYTDSWQGYNASTIARPCKITTYGAAGRAIISTATGLTFSQNGTYPVVYQSPAIIGLDTNSVADLSNVEIINGESHGVRLLRVANLLTVSTTLNSYFYDSATDILYIRTFNDRAPDSNIICLRSVENAVNTGKENLHLQNLEFWGGSSTGGVLNNNNTTGTMQNTVIVNCHFKYSNNCDGSYHGGNIVVSSKDCVCYANYHDGFNYAFNTTNTAIGFEYKCIGWRNGYGSTGTGGADNGSTTHGDGKMIRVWGNYQFNANRNVHDIQDSVSFNVGCVAGETTTSAGTTRVAFAIGAESDGANNATGYYLECFSTHGGSITDLAVYINCTAYVAGDIMRQTILRQANTKVRQVLFSNSKTYSAEYQAYLDELTKIGIALPSSTDQTKDNNLIVGLKTDNEWNNISMLLRFKGSGSQAAALVKLKQPGLYKALAVSAIVWNSTDGFGSNGSSSYINSNWNLTLDELMTQDSYFFGVWVTVGGSIAGVNRSLLGANTSIFLGERSVTNIAARAGSTTNEEFTGNVDVVSNKFYSFRRTASNVVELYVDGVLVTTTSTASVTLPSDLVFILATGTAGSPSIYANSVWRIGGVVFGSGATNPLKLYNRLAARFL